MGRCVGPPAADRTSVSSASWQGCLQSDTKTALSIAKSQAKFLTFVILITFLVTELSRGVSALDLIPIKFWFIGDRSWDEPLDWNFIFNLGQRIWFLNYRLRHWSIRTSAARWGGGAQSCRTPLPTGLTKPTVCYRLHQVAGCQERSVTINTCLGVCLSFSTPTGANYKQVESCTCCRQIKTEKVDVGLWCQDKADPSNLVKYFHPIETATECACASC